MTAQVAVFNMQCVAVASDSMITVTNGTTQRMLPSSDKVFDLGDGHRVVALSSGSTRCMDIPIGVLVSEWAATLASPLDQLADYPEAFVRWLATRTDLIITSTQDTHFAWQLRDYYRMVRTDVLEAIHEAGLSQAPWDDVSVQAIVNRVVDTDIEAIRSRADLPDLDASEDENYLTAQQEAVEYSLLDSTEDMPITVEARSRLLDELPALILSKAEPWSHDATLAFVGYGAAETFPGQVTVILHGIVADQVRYHELDRGSISPHNQAFVAPFGQDEAIDTFVRAFNPEFLSLAHNRLDELLTLVDLSQGIIDSEESPEDIARRMHDGLNEDFNQLARQRFVLPMLDTVESLPPADVARMAESLVGVQALRSLSQHRQPSVGGPIDVVLITRPGGVQWIRRKEVVLA